MAEIAEKKDTKQDEPVNIRATVPADVHRIILRHQGKLQDKTGKRPTFEDALIDFIRTKK